MDIADLPVMYRHTAKVGISLASQFTQSLSDTSDPRDWRLDPGQEVSCPCPCLFLPYSTFFHSSMEAICQCSFSGNKVESSCGKRKWVCVGGTHTLVNSEMCSSLDFWRWWYLMDIISYRYGFEAKANERSWYSVELRLKFDSIH